MNSVKSTQIFSVFGGGYVSESHGQNSFFLEKSKTRPVKWVAVACLLVWGATTATAITKSQSAATDYSWSQPSNFFKNPFNGGIETAVY